MCDLHKWNQFIPVYSHVVSETASVETPKQEVWCIWMVWGEYHGKFHALKSATAIMLYSHHNHQVVDNSLASFLDLPHLQFWIAWFAQAFPNKNKNKNKLEIGTRQRQSGNDNRQTLIASFRPLLAESLFQRSSLNEVTVFSFAFTLGPWACSTRQHLRGIQDCIHSTNDVPHRLPLWNTRLHGGHPRSRAPTYNQQQQ